MNGSKKRAAFDEWKLGTRLFPVTSQRDFNAAIKYFERARGLDPEFARAYGWLAYTYMTGLIDAWSFPKSVGGLSPKKIRQKAKRLAKKAVELDPEDFDNHWALGFVLLRTSDLPGAERHFDLARHLNFGNRELLTENADERVYAGDADKAIELIMRARKIPDWQRWVLAWAYYFKARKDPIFYDMALDELRQLTDPPGSGKAPAEILILLAAIHGQRSLLSKGTIAASERKMANDARKIYEKLRKKRRIDEIDDAKVFAKAADRKHWRTGLEEAGF